MGRILDLELLDLDSQVSFVSSSLPKTSLLPVSFSRSTRWGATQYCQLCETSRDLSYGFLSCSPRMQSKSLGIRPRLGHFGIHIKDGGFSPGIDVQLFENPLQVGADGFVTHLQFLRDQFVGMTDGDELQNLFFPGGKARGFIRGFGGLAKRLVIRRASFVSTDNRQPRLQAP